MESSSIRERALRESVQIAELVSGMFKPCLGPKAMAKLVVKGDEVWISEDASVVLEKSEVRHPVAKLILDAVKSVGPVTGGGTSELTILIGELVKNADKLILKKIHPNTIVHGWRLALGECLDRAPFIRIDPFDETALARIATTELIPGARERAGTHLGNIAAQAVLRVSSGKIVDLNNVRLERLLAGSPEESLLIPGIALRHELADPLGPKSIRGAKIAIIKGELLPSKPGGGWRAEVKLELTDGRLSSVGQYRLDRLRRLADKVLSVGANVAMVEKGIDEYAIGYLSSRNVLAVRRISIYDLERIAKATHGKVAYHIDELSELDLGFAGLVGERIIAGNRWIFVEGCADPKSVTILLRGTEDHRLLYLEKLVLRSLHAVREVHLLPEVVASGGSLEMELSCKLTRFASSLAGREQLAVQSFAEALEAIAATVAHNAGMDPIRTLTELRATHATGQTWSGVDSSERKVRDMMELGFYESLASKKKILSAACEVASTLIRIDTYYMSKEIVKGEERLAKEKEKGLEPERVKKIKADYGIE